MNKFLYVALCLLLFGSCSKKLAPGTTNENVERQTQEVIEPKPATEILWDEWGVPHIYASNNADLFYSFGYAQMHSHANTILQNFAHSRGSAAEHWGESKVENDMLVHTLDFHKVADFMYNDQSLEFKTYIQKFVDGMNAYTKAHPDAVTDFNKAFLPVKKEDIFLHSLFVLYTRFIGGGALGQVPNWERTGSNTYAVGPSRSASGNAMLVMNPHLPWYDEWMFYEAHLNAPGLNMYGATLLGFPTLGIAFNENLGWSHTNNTIDNADLFELTLKDEGYEYDGTVKAFDVRSGSIKVKKNGVLSTIDFPIKESIHGPVVREKNGKAITIKMPGFDRSGGMKQWWSMATAKNFTQFESALKKVDIPFFNIMYADKQGNIFYMFNGQVPKRQKGDWNYWSGVVDGSDPMNFWEDLHSYEELPKIKNPAQGWLQNANDPPWTSTFPRLLDHNDFPPYMSPVRMSFRPQRSARQLAEDESITFDELVAYKNSTRIEMADRILDDLHDAIFRYGSGNTLLMKADTVLMNWDRHANADSKGMALFYQWAQTLNPYKQSNYKEKWSLDKARTTPDGLADPLAAVRALEGVAKFMTSNGIPLDVPWGTVYRIKYNDKDLPGNGADGSVGVFRVAWAEDGLQDDGKLYINGGDTWQSVIEFGDKVKAKVLMSYGNSTQKGSPNYGDQLELFSKREMRDCYFYKEDVLKHFKIKEILGPNGFTPMQ